MLLSVIIYIFLILLLLYLPERNWQILFAFYNRSKDVYNDKVNTIKKKSMIYKAQKLQNYLTQLESQLSLGRMSKLGEIPMYGFYTKLIEKLIEGHQKFGLSLKSIIQDLKSNLIKEIQFEKKCTALEFNGKLQFFIMSLTTWGFIFFTSLMVNIDIKFKDIIIILSLQVCGSFVFIKLSQKIKFIQFHKYSLTIERLYLFLNRVELGFSHTRALSESMVLEGPLFNEKEFLPCATRILNSVEKWKDSGISPKAECMDILEEVWHQKSMSFERYLKQLEGLKFTCLSLFYLPAYFYYLYSIFQFFMDQ